MVPDTGQLATAVFDLVGGGSFDARFTMIGELQRAIDKLDASALDTEDEKEYVAGDLIEPGEIECELFFDGLQSIPEPKVKADLTVTYPLGEGQVTAASWTASGFFMTKTLPSAQLNTLMKAKVKFAFDGRATKFIFTPATD